MKEALEAFVVTGMVLGTIVFTFAALIILNPWAWLFGIVYLLLK